MAPVAAKSHVGLVREANEDAVLVACNGRLLACADGLGGLPAGAEAATLALSELEAALLPYLADGAESAGTAIWLARLEAAFFGAHEAIVQAGHASAALRGMATTLVAAVTTTRRAYICHVGDVRAYHSRQGRLRRVTDDHSVVFEAVKAGRMSAEQARLAPSRNLVTQALGLPEGLAPATTVISLLRDDLLLLCSDGLWEAVAESELAVALAAVEKLDAGASSLVARALEAGGHDNISVVLYRHG